MQAEKEALAKCADAAAAAPVGAPQREKRGENYSKFSSKDSPGKRGRSKDSCSGHQKKHRLGEDVESGAASTSSAPHEGEGEEEETEVHWKRTG